MQDPILMAERSAFEKLVHETPDSDGIERATVAVDVHIFLQVALTVLKDENELDLRVDNIVEANDVDVLELLHKRDLADGGGWCAFLRIEMDLLKRDDLVCRPRSTLQLMLSCGIWRMCRPRTLYTVAYVPSPEHCMSHRLSIEPFRRNIT